MQDRPHLDKDALRHTWNVRDIPKQFLPKKYPGTLLEPRWMAQTVPRALAALRVFSQILCCPVARFVREESEFFELSRIAES